MNNNPILNTNPLQAVVLPNDVILKVQTVKTFTVLDAYNMTLICDPKHTCFKPRELTGKDVLKALNQDYASAISRYVNEVLRGGVVYNMSIAQSIDKVIDPPAYVNTSLKI